MNSLQIIQRLIVKQFELKIEDLGPDAQLDSLGLDSLSVIELMFDLEDELNITLPKEPVELMSIGDVASFIDNIIASQKATTQQASK